MQVILGLGLCTPHSNNLEKVTDFVIEQIKSRCKEFLDEEKYSNLANTSKDKIIKNKYNVKNEILILEKKIKDINKTLPMYKYIKHITITDEPLIKTTTNKIKRKEELDKILEKEVTCG